MPGTLIVLIWILVLYRYLPPYLDLSLSLSLYLYISSLSLPLYLSPFRFLPLYLSRPPTPPPLFFSLSLPLLYLAKKSVININGQMKRGILILPNLQPFKLQINSNSNSLSQLSLPPLSSSFSLSPFLFPLSLPLSFSLSLSFPLFPSLFLSLPLSLPLSFSLFLSLFLSLPLSLPFSSPSPSLSLPPLSPSPFLSPLSLSPSFSLSIPLSIPSPCYSSLLKQRDPAAIPVATTTLSLTQDNTNLSESLNQCTHHVTCAVNTGHTDFRDIKFIHT